MADTQPYTRAVAKRIGIRAITQEHPCNRNRCGVRRIDWVVKIDGTFPNTHGTDFESAYVVRRCHNSSAGSAIRKALINKAKLKHIPMVGCRVVGPNNVLIDAFKFIFHRKVNHTIIQEGYSRYYGSTLEVPLINEWVLVVSGPEKVDDIPKSSQTSLEQLSSFAIIDVSMSYSQGVNRSQRRLYLLQVNHAMDHSLCVDPYHAEVVRGPLTCNIASCFVVVHDEVKAAFEGNIPVTKEWIEVSAYQTAQRIDPQTPKMREFLNEIIQEWLNQESVHGKDWPGKPEGYTKAAMGKMNKLDSFLKEAQRLYGTVGAFGMRRVTQSDFIFPDTMFIPASTEIAVAALATNIDEALMSHVLLNSDVKMDTLPSSTWIAGDQIPNQSSKVLFRKRVHTP
ncbi:hypothetical protein IW261DRAFT_1423082 [Armillaria novae-zelandiae]|uniref:Uncharacterized protein n=1 Tax=Armillaria novae-zelandiae TaxID=153914 RepID=A0AA39U9H6_9AGAR|nr:hypothetical protein IW261DRAFT_1423082 [Armillaria novae-zelandiae]